MEWRETRERGGKNGAFRFLKTESNRKLKEIKKNRITIYSKVLVTIATAATTSTTITTTALPALARHPISKPPYELSVQRTKRRFLTDLL